MCFWRGHRNSGFFPILQEFFAGIPVGRNSCIYSGFRRIPEDSGGFLFPPKAVWLRPSMPATKEGTLLSKIWTKIDIFNLSPNRTDHGVRCPRPLLAPPGLKVRAAEEADTVLEEEAALMAEALADVALAKTIATADADNSRQQTTINNRLGAKPCLAMATTEVASWR
jgi:hypothetical protein